MPVRVNRGNPNRPGSLVLRNVNPETHVRSITFTNRVVWVSDRWYNFVHAYSLPDLNHIGAVPIDVDPFRITFTPDSRFAYVSNAASATLSVIDTQAFAGGGARPGRTGAQARRDGNAAVLRRQRSLLGFAIERLIQQGSSVTDGEFTGTVSD